MTRTQDGYAFWKEDPQTVAAARVQAKGRIAEKALVDLVRRPVVRILDSMIDYYTPKGKP